MGFNGGLMGFNGGLMGFNGGLMGFNGFNRIIYLSTMGWFTIGLSTLPVVENNQNGDLPSGKHTKKNCGTSPFSMSKFTISMAIFNIAILT